MASTPDIEERATTNEIEGNVPNVLQDMYFTVPLTNNITISNSCKCEQKLITKLITPSTAKAKQLAATHVGFHRLTPSLISPIPVPRIAHDTGQDFHQSKGRIKLYDSEVSKNMTACMTPTPLRHHFISCPPIPLRSLQPPPSPQPLQLKLKPKKHRRRGKNKSKRPKQSTQTECHPISEFKRSHNVLPLPSLFPTMANCYPEEPTMKTTERPAAILTAATTTM
ncbi:hypothetical protein EI94DRAFT_1695496 [Lactarius quietus]|nr:hypothetical protein EI94DRAFT_1695496 [Lactarius quietus]